MKAATDGGVRFAVRHRTEFHYSSWIVGNANTVHLEPADFASQKTLGSIIKVLPATRLSRFTDPFGNITHTYEIATQHTRMVVESQIRVLRMPLRISDAGYSAGMDFFRSPDFTENCGAYLGESRWVSFSPEIRRHAAEITLAHDAVFEKAAAIMRWINSGFSYEPGVTDAETHPDTALRLR